MARSLAPITTYAAKGAAVYAAPRSNQEHRRIVAALARRAGEEAERLTRRQIFNTVRMLRTGRQACARRQRNGPSATVR